MKVLGVSYGGGHANIIIPVLRELDKRAHETVLLGLTAAGPQAAAQNFPYKAYSDFIHLVDKERVYALGESLAREMHNPEFNLSLEESIYYLGINLLESINTLGESVTNEAVRRSGRQALLPVEFMKRVLEEEACDLVIATNSPRSEKASLLAAQELGLKTVRIEDLYGIPILHDTFMRKLGTELYRKTTGRFKLKPTLSCFLCDYAMKNFIENQDLWDVQGVSLENSVITGQPIFDEIDDLVTRPARFNLFESQDARPTVTWVVENGHDDTTAVINLVSEWYRKNRNRYNFIVKLRPNFNAQESRDILSRFDFPGPHFRVIKSEVSASEVLWNSSVILAQESTMLTQAAYMGRPIIIMDPEGKRTDNPLIELNMAPVTRGPGDIEAAVSQLLDKASVQSENYRQGLKKMSFKSNGTLNIADAIEKILN